MQEASTRLEIDEALATLGSPAHAAAGGSGAALAGALAASVVAKAARISARAGSAAQAVALEDRLLRFAEADAAVLGEARAALEQHRSEEPEGDSRRDYELGTALRRALLVPCSIGEACADVAELAAEERETVAPDYRADLAAAAAIAAGAAHAAAHLVSVNLIATPDDADVVAARRFAARATAVAGLFGAL
ncbi:MAG TPA: cyclodeaminase/cyclohydrolase family protein [Gaiellaceae bacterium]|nr:cyclodeaminase/cyclohydrolase family protein [Gaiellaceae bacterium]